MGNQVINIMVVGTFTYAEYDVPIPGNSKGKIIYEQVGAVVDRLEGNTQGKTAVFGLLRTAGLKLSANPGDGVYQLIQRLGHFLGSQGCSWSKEEDIPK